MRKTKKASDGFGAFGFLAGGGDSYSNCCLAVGFLCRRERRPRRSAGGPMWPPAGGASPSPTARCNIPINPNLKHFPIAQITKRGGQASPFLVRVTGLEPALTRNRILNPARLPIPPYPRTTVLYHKTPDLSSRFPRKRREEHQKIRLTKFLF